MRLAAVIHYYGRPVAVVYGGHPAPAVSTHKGKARRREDAAAARFSQGPGRVSSGRALYGWVIWRCESSCWVRAGGTRSTLRLSYPSSRGPGDLQVQAEKNKRERSKFSRASKKAAGGPCGWPSYAWQRLAHRQLLAAPLGSHRQICTRAAEYNLGPPYHTTP